MTSEVSAHLAQVAAMRKAIKDMEVKVIKLKNEFSDLAKVLEDDVAGRNAMVEQKSKSLDFLDGDALLNIDKDIEEFEGRIIRAKGRMTEIKKEVGRLQSMIDIKNSSIDAILDAAGEDEL